MKAKKIIQQILFGILLTVSMSFIGLVAGAIIGGNISSPYEQSPLHYAGVYGYEAGGLFGAHLGIALGIIFTIISIVKQNNKILKIASKITFGIFFTMMLYFLGNFFGSELIPSSDKSPLFGGVIGAIIGIIFTIYINMNTISSKKSEETKKI